MDVAALKAQRWIRALALAKLLFDDEGYFTTYLDEIEQFIKEKANQFDESARFNREELGQPVGHFWTQLLTSVHKWLIMLNTTKHEALLNMAYGRYMEQLREKVKELRKRMRWSQEDLAREIGVSLSTVQRWEKQGGEPTRLPRRELTRLFQEAGIDDRQR